jgi:hypothetical protein
VAGRGRPPRLEPRAYAGTARVAPTAEELLVRAKVAGAGGPPGRTELRASVEHMAAGDRRALGELAPMKGVSAVDAWAAVTAAFGASPEQPFVDPAHTLAAAARAATRVREVAAGHGTVAFACAAPASLLGVLAALARVARAAGAGVADVDEVGPFRADGRSARFLRQIEGVALLTDRRALLPAVSGDAAREWTFALGRPALVAADGPFAEVAWEAGLDVIAFAGLDRPALAVAAARHDRCLLVPLRTDRPAAAYRPVVDAFEAPH